jgi:FliI/YscN family ATPase
MNPLQARAPHPLDRERIREPLGTGVRAIDSLLTCGKGQRLGLFAGSGVGKSTLLGMCARGTAADVTVIGLVGERGREVREFVEKDLGPEGLQRSVVVVETSDRPALLRVRAPFAAVAVAEYFRDEGLDVLLLLDSITRMANAQREVGLSAGEPPATKGYPPSVFALLPRLLERAGRSGKGTITGFYTVLVEGDDANEPISDAARSILDGHVWLSRDLAVRGHYPSIDPLQSVSRLLHDVAPREQVDAATRLRSLLAAYREAEDLINVGAYVKGSNPEIDLAVRCRPAIQKFLRQGVAETATLDATRAALLDLAKSFGKET